MNDSIQLGIFQLNPKYFYQNCKWFNYFMFWFFSILSLSDEETPSGIPINELESKIDEFVNTYVGSKVPSASIIISRYGTDVFRKSYGYANIEKQENATIDHLYEWGSVTKL